jgi:hypothetical protein
VGGGGLSNGENIIAGLVQHAKAPLEMTGTRVLEGYATKLIVKLWREIWGRGNRVHPSSPTAQ